MRIFGLDIFVSKASPPANLHPPMDRGRWWSNMGIVREPYAGAWQRNIEIRTDTVLTFSAVYACITLIAGDVGKLRPKLVEQDGDGIWTEIESAAFSPVLRKPNHYQTRIKFIEQWTASKLIHGNTYALKVRDERRVVVALYILDATRVKVLVAPNGDVYYEIRRDDLSGVDSDTVTVPASEIIHDTMVALYHPLVGVSPISACGLAAMQGIRIQNNSAQFFGNMSNPGGVLTAPGIINAETAERLKAHWEANFTGENFGKVAVLGDGLKYEAMAVNAHDSQLIEQLKWSAETVCSCFHVPPYMIGVGPMPTYNNIEALNQQYYTQCLQSLIESLELCLDEGLGLVNVKDHTYGVELDLDGLLRMDTSTQYKTLGDGIGSGLLTPNEARWKLDKKPIAGGDTVYIQEQNYSLAALAKRDAMANPFGAKAPPPALPAPSKPAAEEADDEDEVKNWDFIRAALDAGIRAEPLLLTHQ